jgi:hypothetical protein
VELVFVLDEQSTCTSADWQAMNYFALGVIQSFPVSAATRFGVVYTGNAAPHWVKCHSSLISWAPQHSCFPTTDILTGSPTSSWPATTLLSTNLATWENYLGCPTPTCATQKLPAHIAVGGTSTNFAAAINLALTTFWSGPITGVKREVLTFVCGPSSSSADAISTMQANLKAANIEYWAIGLDQGDGFR